MKRFDLFFVVAFSVTLLFMMPGCAPEGLMDGLEATHPKMVDNAKKLYATVVNADQAATKGEFNVDNLGFNLSDKDPVILCLTPLILEDAEIEDDGKIYAQPLTNIALYPSCWIENTVNFKSAEEVDEESVLSLLGSNDQEDPVGPENPDGLAVAELPARYEGGAGTSPDSFFPPMWAIIDSLETTDTVPGSTAEDGTGTGYYYFFKHLAGMMRVHLMNIPVGTNSVVFVFNQPVSGYFDIVPYDAEPGNYILKIQEEEKTNVLAQAAEAMLAQANQSSSNVLQLLGGSTQKLSTGYRINRAADDAAGLSISEKMRVRIRSKYNLYFDLPDTSTPERNEFDFYIPLPVASYTGITVMALNITAQEAMQVFSATAAQIVDTDMAQEMTEYSKNNILQQAAQEMLAQGNEASQGVLQLLGAMVVQHNMSSMNALNINSLALAKSLEKLSSGYKINRANIGLAPYILSYLSSDSWTWDCPRAVSKKLNVTLPTVEKMSLTWPNGVTGEGIDFNN